MDGGITWVPWSSPYPLRTLLPGDNRTVLIRGTVSPSAQAGPLSNTAVVSSTTPDPNPDNNTDTAPVEVEQSADLSVVKEGGTSPAVPGQQFQYTITVGNSGPSDGQNVILTDSVPAALLGQEFSLDNGATWAPWSSPYGVGHPARRTEPLGPAAGHCKHNCGRYPGQHSGGGLYYPGPGPQQQQFH